ncbi:MAG: FIST N-terminal domain-containing protein [Campylobacterota bacterium]|nr:FIST N-terminal domain-containing protein [Campylobacterota bacterium]
MKTLNIQYSGDKALKEFMEENNILQKQNVLLQIFTAICEVEFIEELVSSIKKTAPNINIIGATTDGEIIEEKVVSHSTILSFSIFENTKIKLYTTTAQKASFQTAKRLLKKIEDVDDAKVAIVFTDGLNINGEVFLKAFNKHVPNLTVAGGLAADNAQFNKTYVFTGDGIVNNSAVAAVLYSPDLIVNTAFSFGWEIIGKEFRVTNAIENRVYTIDNQTPIELYKKYLGDKIGGQLPATGIEFPLILNRDGIKIARAVVAKESDGSLIFAGNIKKGDKVSFGYGNVKHILNNITDTFDDIIQNPVESIFIYSCMARKRLLGDEIQTEIMPLSKIAPTSGFFTYGEFHNCNKLNSCKNQLLNQTMTILALSEDKNKINSNQTIQMPSLKKNMQTVEAFILPQLVKTTFPKSLFLPKL